MYEDGCVLWVGFRIAGHGFVFLGGWGCPVMVCGLRWERSGGRVVLVLGHQVKTRGYVITT